MEHMNVVCDGKDYSGVLKKYRCHSILFLNISSYAGGTHPWKKATPNFKPPSMNDGLIEVIALDQWDLPILQMGGHGGGYGSMSSGGHGHMSMGGYGGSKKDTHIWSIYVGKKYTFSDLTGKMVLYFILL